ncbi:aminotransferase class I/II-fold pyridoxal phosphate-dependent enzyme [Ammoniphilus resinae]|uniref:Arginine/lysine/ornithine decarboxylase n=1 Tax=Ammoniphilus resinae TaxID=861532 RepID=A0ABS4GRC3_9BACL|nr:aminotransferase class I/II-fold pyridoxal phosphate-dependent enzyme [Ammoniphilus resinae]MBP1932425.1 arginine/lysine/ornithine decarboxylase [Ammoniphilus resinae]
MDQKQIPIEQAMSRYAEKNTVRFHVPGHKGRGQGSFLSSILPYDVTELPGLDDLHHPEEAILEAQRLAAEVFGAEESFFLIGGSTVGNLALLLTVCRPGELVLVQRNVHKSIIHGLILAQARPIYLKPEMDLATGQAIGVSLVELQRKIKEYPKAKAVFLCNPNYYGMGFDLRAYSECCHSAGMPLLVDEAHGAHFGFSEGLPPSAMQCGADAAVQSTHKMLSSMTMSSMLHIQGDLIERTRLRQVLTMVQSSSPSYPLLASLDRARYELALRGEELFREGLLLAKRLRQGVRDIGIPWLSAVGREGVYDFLDPLKVTLQTRASLCSGFRLKEHLEVGGIYPEMADERLVLLALSAETKEEDIKRTLEVISSLDRGLPVDDTLRAHKVHFSQQVVLTPHEVFHRGPRVTIPFYQAEGKIAAEMIAPYPPGIPVVNPGERIDRETIDYLIELKEQGCRMHGISDPTLQTVLVVGGSDEE